MALLSKALGPANLLKYAIIYSRWWLDYRPRELFLQGMLIILYENRQIKDSDRFAGFLRECASRTKPFLEIGYFAGSEEKLSGFAFNVGARF